MFALGMVDQPHHAQRPVLHCPKSQFANSLFPRYHSVAADRPADKPFSLLSADDRDLRNRDS
jgi:hypothetical protein